MPELGTQGEEECARWRDGGPRDQGREVGAFQKRGQLEQGLTQYSRCSVNCLKGSRMIQDRTQGLMWDSWAQDLCPSLSSC